MAVESPTGGPYDVVFNTNGLALLWCYAWEDLIPGFRCLVRMDVLTGADPLTGVVLPCHIGAVLAASRVGCATHAIHSA